jgi:plasmid stabilization system protein ParE
MATADLPHDESQTNIDDQHLEIFSLIWLDTNVNVKETRNTEQKLRSIINHLKKFQDVKQCQQYIEQRSQKDRLLLIVSGQMGQEMVPSIHQLRQVISIYVYCMDKKGNEEWASKFSKVSAEDFDFIF